MRLSSCGTGRNAGWGARIRTWEWRNQNLPDHLDLSRIFSRLRTKAPMLHQYVTSDFPTVDACTQKAMASTGASRAWCSSTRCPTYSTRTFRLSSARAFSTSRSAGALTPDEEMLLATALLTAGGDPERIATCFIGLCHIALNPTATALRGGSEEGWHYLRSLQPP